MGVTDWLTNGPVVDVSRAVRDGAREEGRTLALEAVRSGAGHLAPAEHRGILTGAAAGLWVDAALDSVASRWLALDDVRAYSPYVWLWILRRLPDDLFADPIHGKGARNRTITESVARMVGSGPGLDREAQSSTSRRSSGVELRVADFEVMAMLDRDPGYAHRAARLLGFCITVGQLMDARLLGAGGATFEFTGEVMPRVILRGKEALSLLLADLRLSRQQHLDRLGIYPDVSTDPSAPASAEDPAVLLLHRRDVPLDMPVRVILDGIEASSITAGPNEVLRTYYALERRSLRSFARLLSRDQVRNWSLWHNELATVLAGLLISAVCFNEGPKARLRALGLGYIVVARDHAIQLYGFLHPAVEGVLRTMLGGVAPPVPPTGEAWLAALTALPPDPLRLALGPCLLESTDDWAMLDWAGLSLRFGQVLEYPRLAGEIANVRARAFEEALQEAIDQTPWAPPPELRRLAGRDLKRGGRVIGEVDAVAHKDGRTLLVSAKSISVGDAYVAGDHNARREAAQKVLAALSRWDALLADLRADLAPESANYDVRSAGDLIGVVVTPNALAVPLDAAVRMTAVPGVLAYMSVHELLERLRAN